MRIIRALGLACVLFQCVAHAQLLTLNFPGATDTDVTGISGDNVVGFAIFGNVETSFAYNITSPGYSSLNEPNADTGVAGGGTIAMGIDGNLIVGDYIDSNSEVHGFVYNGTVVISNTTNNITTNTTVFSTTGGTFTTVIDPSAPSSGNFANNTYLTGISNGVAIGTYSDGNISHGFIYNGGFTAQDNPSETFGTYLTGIVGGTTLGYYLDSGFTVHGFTNTGGTYTYLPAPPTGYRSPIPMSFSGSLIIGELANTSGNLFGFTYNGTGYNIYTVPNANDTIITGYSGGDYVGYYTDSSGVTHGFLASDLSDLTQVGQPQSVPEPAAWSLLAGGLALAWTARRKFRRAL